MIALLIGLPLLTAYYAVNPGFYVTTIVPYLAISALITMYIIRRSIKFGTNYGGPSIPLAQSDSRSFAARFNSLSSNIVIGLASLMVVVFGALRYLIYTSYPYTPPRSADYLGEAYIILLAVVSVLGFSRIIYSSSPVLRNILAQKKYNFMAAAIAASFAFVYLLLVNEILIAGLNTIANSSPPGNVYPFAHVFTVGIQEPFLNLVYLPYGLVQISPQINFLIVPFELVFTALLSLLVASNVVMAHYLISNSGLACSTKGAVLSTGGSIIGLTATCPTCLVPTFVSVLFGGVVAAEAVYSNIYGVIIPPVLSVGTLVISLVFLSRMIKQRTRISEIIR